MSSDVLGFHEIDRRHVAVVGGKGANLGELSRIAGIRVPDGFCVTTNAYRRVVRGVVRLDALLDRLSRLRADDHDAIAELSAEIRGTIEATPIPDDLAGVVGTAVERLGADAAYAVRSSATAEDLPSASFAGQGDSFLNVVGPDAIVRDVRRCWASLFTDRAVTYRLRNGIDEHEVEMAVVVQRMLTPQVSGVLFTADPLTGNRTVTTVEATFGLGEALVSGLVKADVYRIRDGAIVGRMVGTKALAVTALEGGGTEHRSVAPDRAARPALSDRQVLRLAEAGRRIEAQLGGPQDVEWCLVDEDVEIVQARPITTLFPIPDVTDDENHVYLSVGHQQMMTDPMKPLGLSFWQMTTPRPMAEAGGRLFVDVTRALGSPASRAALLEAAARSDPLMRDALQTVLDRPGFVPSRPDPDPTAGPPVGGAPEAGPIEADPAIVTELIARSEASVAELTRGIAGQSGEALLDFIEADLQELRRLLFDPRSNGVWMAAMAATWWLNDHLAAWLDETNAADALSQSVPHNVTSEMGLALLDVADVVRAYPDVVAFLGRVDDDRFLDELPRVRGGQEARDAIERWLDRYGMRCVGEIDITRPRWSERPSTLLPAILANVRNFRPGESRRRFQRGLHEAREKEAELLTRVRALPDGERKAVEMKQMVDRVRTFMGYREYPKYGMVSRYFVYKRALLAEAERLVAAGVLRETEDLFYVTFGELRAAVTSRRVDHALIRERRRAFRWYGPLTPPRVMTSDGEAFAGTYQRTDVPFGSLAGLGVSAGTVEGRARVVLDMAEADLEPGDILVTTATDPSWTPLFVAIAGLVTEVGGLMTHGAVIAREYGLPAVVGIAGATRLIRDGQRIRVHGADGFVELLDEGPRGPSVGSGADTRI